MCVMTGLMQFQQRVGTRRYAVSLRTNYLVLKRATGDASTSRMLVTSLESHFRGTLIAIEVGNMDLVCIRTQSMPFLSHHLRFAILNYCCDLFHNPNVVSEIPHDWISLSANRSMEYITRCSSRNRVLNKLVLTADCDCFV